MHLVRFIEPITVAFKKSSGGTTVTFEAGRDYVISDSQLGRILTDENIRNRAFKVSNLDSRIENFHIQARRIGTQRILIHNGSGGYGDQILTWPLAALLSTMGLEVHILTEPGNNVCWWHFPFIKSISLVPIPYELVKLYDHFLVYESVVNKDEHPDQDHPLDVMLKKIGIDPKAVDSKLKAVQPVFTGSELYMSQERFKDKQIAIYQMSSANPVRCLPPNDSIFMLIKIAEAFPDYHWLALWDEFIPKEYKEVLEQKIEQLKLVNVEPYTSQNLRELWAMTRRAAVVIGPDSMMVHVAGTMGVPCVGLWGPMSPQSRVKYYPRHVPIFHKEFCPHAPCFAYTSTFPKYCPPRNERKVCEVIAGISPADVVDAVKQVLAPRNGS